MGIHHLDLVVTSLERSVAAVDGLPAEIVYAGSYARGIWRSPDGGATWGAERRLSPFVAASAVTGLIGCQIRTDSRGTVYVFWEQNPQPRTGTMMMTRSFDGGRSFEAPRAVAHFVQSGRLDPLTGLFTFDGVAGARTAATTVGG